MRMLINGNSGGRYMKKVNRDMILSPGQDLQSWGPKGNQKVEASDSSNKLYYDSSFFLLFLTNIDGRTTGPNYTLLGGPNYMTRYKGRHTSY
jgi:hypothetical protein